MNCAHVFDALNINSVCTIHNPWISCSCPTSHDSKCFFVNRTWLCDNHVQVISLNTISAFHNADTTHNIFVPFPLMRFNQKLRQRSHEPLVSLLVNNIITTDPCATTMHSFNLPSLRQRQRYEMCWLDVFYKRANSAGFVVKNWVVFGG